MKSELKIEYNHPKQLEKVIKKSYFEDETIGRLVGKKDYLEIDEENEIYPLVKGLNNMTIRLFNEEVMEGTCRFIIEEEENIKLYPISMFCIIDDNKKYSFY